MDLQAMKAKKLVREALARQRKKQKPTNQDLKLKLLRQAIQNVRSKESS
ncbi:MAG: hypothetical protein NTU73_05785 [Ignavibacteriae bacterium]|nr:hypothetical protein [Ignavibacteriota bacterium]